VGVMLKTTALVAALALGLAACGSSKSSSNTSSSASTASSAPASAGGYGTKQSTTTTASSSGNSAHEVEMYDDYFKSKTITGKPGSTVKIVLKNQGKNQHNFKIDSQKQANADVKPGAQATVSVKIPTSGSVQFYCEYHKGLGMVGTVKPA
jgi:plastocyanin